MSDPSSTAQLQHWLDLLRTGDKQSRDRLIEHTCERLRRLTRKMLGGFPGVRRWEETDDVFTEAVSKLHHSLESVCPESPRQFYGLAATQIRRVLIDMARHYHGPQGLASNQDTGGLDRAGQKGGDREPGDRTDEPASLSEWTEFHGLVESLPEEEREVFNLLWYEGVPQAEAARILGISPRTLTRRWQDARLRLFQARSGEHLPD
jgi:RNA polymerase sigma-70 factor (ECF subfamily)